MNYNRYINWLLATTAPAVRSWLGDEVLLASMCDELSETVADRMESTAWVERYARACPCEGASPEDYHLRELRIHGDLSILAGIHFYGSLKRFPFVGVFAQSRHISTEELPRVVDHLLREFAVFAPTCVQLWSLREAKHLDHTEDTNRISHDTRFIVGCLPEIAALPQTPDSAHNAERVSVEAESRLESYESYCEIYEEFFADHPQWRGRLEIETCESLQDCADWSGLHRVLIDGEFAGLIAAKPGRYRGVPGWLMIDEVLAKPFRGRGFAPIMQRKFLDQLDTERRKLVMGTIDNANKPSMGTAMRCGRVDAGGDLFVYP